MNEFSLSWRQALRSLRRASKAGELRILALAIVVAVAASSAVGLFSERMRAALAEQSGETLGADVIASGRLPVPDDLAEAARQAGLATSGFVSFPSLLIAGERSALASIKAIEPGYPLRGELRIADEPYGTARRADAVPAPGEAWADVMLWGELGLSEGTEIQVGASRLKVRAVLENEPGRGMGYFDLAPRLLINMSDIAATGLVGAGSRVQYGLLLAGESAALDAIGQHPSGKELRWTRPQDARPEVRNALDRAGLFLDIAVLAAALLAAAAVGLAAHLHGARLRDEVALLKCLGARQGFILRTLVLNLLLIGLASATLGVLLGYAGQALLATLIMSLIENLALPYPPLAPAFTSVVLGLLMLAGFGLPPVLEARRVPPLRVLQRNLLEARRTRLVWTITTMAVIALLVWQTRDLKLALRVLGGALACLSVLGLMAWALVALLTPLKSRVGYSWRFGLGNIARRRGGSVAQVVALGLGLLALLLVTVVRQDLLDSWRDRLPADTPNVFLINIQSEQLDSLKSFFDGHGYAELELWPMARGRLVALNGQPVSAEMFDDPQTQRWINRDFNLSWTDKIGADNKIIEGEWWGESGHGQHWLSADTYAVERLKLKLGDSLTLQFADRSIELVVHNTRKVSWDSFRPNFFLLAAPGILDDVPAQWLTSFYLPPERRSLLRELVSEFPNVTALDIETVMNQVREIMDRIVRAVEFMLLFTLLAGLVVLLAAIEGTRSERARETALLRTLGARTPVLVKGLLAEFAALGLLAGLVAAMAAQMVAWTLATQVFEIPYGPRPWLWLIGGVSGAILVIGLGWLSLRSVLNTPPTRVLQAG